MTLKQEKAARRRVDIGAPLPGFTLPNTGGGSTRLWQFKQRRPLFLAILRDTASMESRAWLTSVAERQAAFADLDVAMLLITPDPLERLRAVQAALDLPFVTLADETGEVISAYLGDSSAAGVAMVAADRYLQCLGVWSASTPRELPSVDETLTQLLAAEQEDCACGMPAWPVE